MSFSGGNNRVDGYSYDASGNLLNDGAHSYTYDAEDRITQVDGGSTATYVYDALGHRVRKTAGGVNTDYVYDLAGHAVAEVGGGCGTNCWFLGEVFAGGRHLATYTNSTTYFVHGGWASLSPLTLGVPHSSRVLRRVRVYSALWSSFSRVQCSGCTGPVRETDSSGSCSRATAWGR